MKTITKRRGVSLANVFLTAGILAMVLVTPNTAVRGPLLSASLQSGNIVAGYTTKDCLSKVPLTNQVNFVIRALVDGDPIPPLISVNELTLKFEVLIAISTTRVTFMENLRKEHFGKFKSSRSDLSVETCREC